MKLGLFANHYHMAGWRHPNAYDLKGDVWGWVKVAQKLEAAKFDFLFFPDAVSMGYLDDPVAFNASSFSGAFEKTSLIAALSMVTKTLGLIQTSSTSFSNPYDMARVAASLDTISQGRTGWNVVTSNVASDALQYGDRPLTDRTERYARAEEYLDVVLALWGSVEPDAYPMNRQTGQYADISKVHKINHHGTFFSVEGPLTANPSPQGRPVIVQAGQSHDGREFAARVAEVVFTAWSEFDMAKDFYDDVKSRVVAKGRDPAALAILPGARIILGRTREEAEEKEAYLNSMLNMDMCLRRAVSGLTDGGTGIDLSRYPLDGPVPDLSNEQGVRLSGKAANHLEVARRQNLTLREFAIKTATSNVHFTASGTASDIADKMEAWFTGGACDGFNVMCAFLPDSLDDFNELVIPELQRRGLFRTEYEGKTLRENLGIPLRPVPARITPVLAA